MGTFTLSQGIFELPFMAFPSHRQNSILCLRFILQELSDLTKVYVPVNVLTDLPTLLTTEFNDFNPHFPIPTFQKLNNLIDQRTGHPLKRRYR